MDINRHCRRTGCMCTHDDPCYAGWVTFKYVEEVKHIRNGIPSINMIDRQAARPCMICDPDRYQIWFSSKTSDEYHERLQSRSSANKNKAYEKDERDKTRTL